MSPQSGRDVPVDPYNKCMDVEQQVAILLSPCTENVPYTSFVKSLLMIAVVLQG